MKRLSPPEGWDQDSLTEFLEDAQQNTYRIVHSYPDHFTMLKQQNSLCKKM